MLQIYKIYIVKSIVPLLIIISFILTSVIWLTQLLKFLYLIDKGITVSHFLYLTLLVIPSLLFIILPLITVISIIIVYVNLNEKRELIILKNAGLSNFNIATAGLIIACILTIISYYISISLMPVSYQRLKADLTTMKNNYVSNIINEKTFIQLSKFITIYVDKNLHDGRLEGIILFDNRDINTKDTIIFANSGNIQIHDGNPIFKLTNGIRQSYDVNENTTRLMFDSLIMELTQHNTKVINDKRHDRDINEYYINELFSPHDSLSENKMVKLYVEGHQRLIWPLYNLLLPFVALSVFLQYPHDKKSQLKSLVSTSSVCIIIIFLHFALQNLASQNIHFIYTSYMNIMIAIAFATFLYLRKSI